MNAQLSAARVQTSTLAEALKDLHARLPGADDRHKVGNLVMFLDGAVQVLRDIEAKQPPAPALAIHVEARNNWGTQALYPACELAKGFTALTGKATLTLLDIDRIKALGYTVHLRGTQGKTL